MTPRRMKLSRRAPHDSIVHPPLCRCGRRPPQCCRWWWRRREWSVSARDPDASSSVPRGSVDRWRGSGGVVTPRQMKLSRRAPHDSIALSPVRICGRQPPQYCRWWWHRRAWSVSARDRDARSSVPRGPVDRWRGSGGVVTPRRMKLSRRAPHASIAHAPVCRCGRRPPQCCRWWWHRRAWSVSARDPDVRSSVPRGSVDRWRGRGGSVTPRRRKLSRRAPHDSIAHSPVCRC